MSSKLLGAQLLQLLHTEGSVPVRGLKKMQFLLTLPIETNMDLFHIPEYMTTCTCAAFLAVYTNS